MHDLRRLAGGDILAQALPAIVTPDTSADMISCATVSELSMVRARTATTAEAEPDTTPQISPTTSLQKLETFSALRSRCRASAAPGTFLAAMAWKGFSSADITATPMISNTMPSATISKSTRNASTSPAPSSTVEEKNEIVEEITTATKKTVTIHRI